MKLRTQIRVVSTEGTNATMPIASLRLNSHTHPQTTNRDIKPDQLIAHSGAEVTLSVQLTSTGRAGLTPAS